LDGIAKSGERLCILTNSPDIDRHLALLTRLVDDIISHWSHYSAQVAYLSLLYNESQQALATRLGRSQPTIHTRLSTAKMELVRAYISFTSEILTSEWKH
jgi:DNA-directed RNA polymerase specialized sigma24 family protein